VSFGWLVIGLAHNSRPVLAFRRRAQRIHARDLERGKRKVDLRAQGLWLMATRTRAIDTGLVFAAATLALPVLSVQSARTEPSKGVIAVHIRYEGGPPTLDDSPRPSAPGRIWVNANDYDQIASLDVGKGRFSSSLSIPGLSDRR
jgi:hypothetical protein